MTVRTRAQLKSDANSAIPDQSTGDVSPADIRQRIIDIADSALLSEDGVVLNTRSIATSTGLTGGGNLSADRTLSIDKATDANVRAAASNKVVTGDLIESASALVTLTDATTIAVDWDSFINGVVTLTTNRILGNPTNGQPGTWRTIRILGNSATDRTLTFGNQYLNVIPTLEDIDSAQMYLLSIFCETTSIFQVFAQKARNW